MFNCRRVRGCGNKRNNGWVPYEQASRGEINDDTLKYKNGKKK